MNELCILRGIFMANGSRLCQYYKQCSETTYLLSFKATVIERSGTTSSGGILNFRASRLYFVNVFKVFFCLVIPSVGVRLSRFKIHYVITIIHQEIKEINANKARRQICSMHVFIIKVPFTVTRAQGRSCGRW